MVMPTQQFLDLLVGYTPGTGISTRRRLTVPRVLGDVEHGVDQHPVALAARLLQGVTSDGGNALHAVASHGDSAEFLKCASIIHQRAGNLLSALNEKGDTPLHCAARAGKSKMLSHLTELAGNGDALHQLLRKENGLKETALHDAVRIGNRDIVERLLEADPELALYPIEGTSPLYLAILLEKDGVARTLHRNSNGNLSYQGPHGQNALHAAILRGTVITEDVLNWNNSLTTQGDIDDRTPLHFGSSLHRRYRVYQPRQDYTFIRFLWHSNIFKQVFEANPAPVYQANKKGLFPIHIAASVGAKGTICIILQKCPSCAGLRNAKGRTFLHVAVEYRRLEVISFVCNSASLSWILNMQDNDGNTALHLAVKARRLRTFCSLYGNKDVHLSLTNNSGQTPLDLSRSLLHRGMNYSLNTNKMIHMALTSVGAKHSGLCWDEIYEKYSRPIKQEDMIKEAEKVKDSSQMLGIGSVLIATVTFGATFAVPGGYVADDHKNAGTPTYAGRYTFDAFVMANTLAFVCSSIATIGLMFSGTSMVHLRTRQFNFGASVFFMSSSLTCLAAALALGVYMVLAPVAHATAIVVCVLSPLVVLSRNFEYLVKWGILARPLCVRMGVIWTSLKLARLLLSQMLHELWPFILIFGWAAIAQRHYYHT